MESTRGNKKNFSDYLLRWKKKIKLLMTTKVRKDDRLGTQDIKTDSEQNFSNEELVLSIKFHTLLEKIVLQSGKNNPLEIWPLFFTH